jgi:hypothetical protein
MKPAFNLILVASVLTVLIASTAGENAVLGDVPQTFQAIAVWGSAQSPIIASPGSSNLPLNVTVLNLGSTVYNVTVTFEAAYPLTPINGESSSISVFLPVLSAGGSIPQIGFYDVASGAQPGLYSENVIVTYSNGAQVFTQTISASVAVLGPNVQQTFAASAVWGSTQSPLVASPGSLNLPLSITFLNLGPNIVSNVNITFKAAYPLVPLSGESASISQYVPAMAAGSSIPLIGYYSLASNATQGVYNETITVSYFNGIQTVSQNLSVNIAVLGPNLPQTFQTSALWGSAQSPILAAPNSTGLPLLVSVVNSGPNAVYNVTATLEPSFPLTGITGQSDPSIFVPALLAGSTLPLLGYFDVSAEAVQGIYNQTLLVTYSNGNQTFTQDLNVGVPILGMPEMQISYFDYTPILIYPGYPEAQLQVVLINTGTSSASGVTATLSTSYPVSPLYPGSETKSIGYMPVGTPVPIIFPLAIANTTGQANTTLSLVVNFSGSQSAAFCIPFTENPKADLEITSITSPTISIGDGSDYMIFTIENTGTAAAEFATVTFVPSNVFQPSIPSSTSPLLATTYLNTTVGTILPGQSVNVTYVISVSSDVSPGTYPLTLAASWSQDAASLPFVQVLSIPTHVGLTLTGSLSSSFVNPVFLALLILLILLIIIAVVILVRRRRKNR